MPIAGALSVEVHHNAYFQSDTVTASFAFNADPTFGLNFWGDPAWDDSNPLILDIQASLDGGATWGSLLIAKIDHVTVHLELGVAQVEGRDLSALLVDSKGIPDQNAYLNQTASQVVETIGARYGLAVDATPTPTLVGRYFDDNRTLQSAAYSHSSTDWNLLTGLARHEKYDLFVSGRTLHFHPITPATSDPFVVVWDKATPFSNVIDLEMERSLSYATDVSVEVKSWNSQQARAFSAHSGQTNAPDGNKFSYVLANIASQADCQAMANRIRADLSRHERLLSFSRPGDLTLSARDLIRVQGTGSSWDTLYVCDSVTRSISFTDGFTQRVQAKTLPQA